MPQIINQTRHGVVFKCCRCSKIHVEFHNLNFNFSEREYNDFVRYIYELDGEYWEDLNKSSLFSRKIRIPIGLSGFCALLHRYELEELKTLLTTYNQIENRVSAIAGQVKFECMLN